MQLGNFSIAPIDIIFTIIVFFMVIKAVFRGFIAEFMGIASIGFGILFGFLFSARLGVFISERFGIKNWSQIIAFLTIFLITYLILKIFENGIRTIIEKINLENLDRSLGLFFGIVEGLIIVILIIFIAQVQPIFETTKLETESFYFRVFQDIIPIGKSILDDAINV